MIQTFSVVMDCEKNPTRLSPPPPPHTHTHTLITRMKGDFILLIDVDLGVRGNSFFRRRKEKRKTSVQSDQRICSSLSCRESALASRATSKFSEL